MDYSIKQLENARVDVELKLKESENERYRLETELRCLELALIDNQAQISGRIYLRKQLSQAIEYLHEVQRKEEPSNG